MSMQLRTDVSIPGIRKNSKQIPILESDSAYGVNFQEGGLQAIVAPILPIPIPGQKDAHFKSACLLAHLIDTGVESERVHFRTKSGLLLTTLDQVIRAVLDDDLSEAGPG